MERVGRLITMGALVALAAGACAPANAPAWSYPPAQVPASAGAVAVAGAGASPAAPVAASAAPAAAAAAHAIEVEAFDLGFRPASISVPAAGTYPVTFHNTGSVTHDMTFADGTKLVADAGATVTGQVVVPDAGLPFMCSIPGHAPRG